MPTKNMRKILNTTLEPYKHDIVGSKDITVCFSLRLYEFNPWVLERLKFQLDFYNPCPKFIIIDLGSQDIYSKQLKKVCSEYENADYIYIEDDDDFSLALGRNIGGRAVETEFIMFSDIDFVYPADIFYTLSKYATELNIKNYIKRVLYFPIYHINEEYTEKFEELKSASQQNNFLTEIGFLGQSTEFGKIFDFIAPYSNAFLIHREFFDMSGGYCDLFKGHGSEDFEYFIRLGLISSDIPIPDKLKNDFYGPLKDTFFTEKDYFGFRRFNELLTIPSELLGLKAFHLWHDKPKDKGYWTKNNDWKRERFNQILDSYYPDVYKILEADYHPREKKALCLISDVDSWGYYLPLRLYGYELVANHSKDENDIHRLITEIESGVYNRVFIFNPYMKSNSHFRVLVEIAKKENVEVTVIERGGLPNSIYYANEVAYGDKDYKNLDNILSDYTPENMYLTKEILANLKKGNEYLEEQDDYNYTWSKYSLARCAENKKIFIPLQLSDDMAVTKFNEGYQKYEDFFGDIIDLAKVYTDTIFIVKKHPLSKVELNLENLENIIVSNTNDNVHALIDISDACIVYNSGVGLLSVLHGNLTFNIGNSYYSMESNLSNQATNLFQALQSFQEGDYSISDDKIILNYLDWLINYKYSWFTANSSIRDFKDRKSHGYKDISVEKISLDGFRKNVGKMSGVYSFDNKSYLGWKGKINLNKESKIKKSKLDQKEAPKKNLGSKELERHKLKNMPAPKIFRLFRKFNNNPEVFFKDSKKPISKLIYKLMYK